MVAMSLMLMPMETECLIAKITALITPWNTEPGICGCDVDTAEPGICGCDVDKAEPGICGCDVSDVDTDGDPSSHGMAWHGIAWHVVGSLLTLMLIFIWLVGCVPRKSCRVVSCRVVSACMRVLLRQPSCCLVYCAGL